MKLTQRCACRCVCELFAGLAGLSYVSGFMVCGGATGFNGCGGTTGLSKVLVFGGITGQSFYDWDKTFSILFSFAGLPTRLFLLEGLLRGLSIFVETNLFTSNLCC